MFFLSPSLKSNSALIDSLISEKVLKTKAIIDVMKYIDRAHFS